MKMKKIMKNSLKEMNRVIEKNSKEDVDIVESNRSQCKTN